MGFLDEVAADDTEHRSQCRVARLRATNPDLAAEVEEARNAGYSLAAISRVLRARDIDISDSSLRRHFRGGCKCR